MFTIYLPKIINERNKTKYLYNIRYIQTPLYTVKTITYTIVYNYAFSIILLDSYVNVAQSQ